MENTNDSGVVLIVLALALTVIILFVALGVDTAMLGSSHQKQSRTAELGALAALETFLSAPGDNTARLTAARARAEEVVGFSLNQFISAKETSQSSAGQIGDRTDGARGNLEPGQYFFNEPIGGCAEFLATTPNNPSTGPSVCPCPDGAFIGECFRPHLSSAEFLTDRPTSSFRLGLYTEAGSPAKTLFAPAGGGASEFTLSSSAISTINPRHVVFLIDMSGSMVTRSHFANDPPLSKVAFRVNQCFSDEADSTTTLGFPCRYLNYQAPATTGHPLSEGPIGRFIWQNVPDCRDQGVIEAIETHYRTDYKCYDVNVEGNPQSYLIDSNYASATSTARSVRYGPALTNPAVDYKGPVPLTQVLDAIHQALLAFDVLSVPGDRVTFLAFDKDARVIPENKRLIGPVSPERCTDTDITLSTSDYCKLFLLTDTENYTQERIEQRIQSLLFPLTGANTDVSEALLRAYDILSQAEGADSADNQVILFGDGLGNCTHSELAQRPVSASTPFLQEGTLDPSNPNTPFRFETCGQSLAEYLESISEAVAMMTGVGRPIPDYIKPFSETGFKLHAFLFGEHIQPHTLVIKGTNGCLTEGQARELRDPFADTGVGDLTVAQNPDEASSTTPFIRPSADFQNDIISPTLGRFFPIRTSCTAADLANLPDSGFTAGTLNCANGDGLRALNNFCSGPTTSGYDFREVIRESYPSVIANGRLICDPNCRSQEEQVRFGINSLFEDNPIITVEPPI